MVSSTTVTKEIRLGELVAIPMTPPLRRQLSLVYPQEKFRSKLLQAFLEFIDSSTMVKDQGLLII